MAKKDTLVSFTIDREELFKFAKALDRVEEGVRKQFISDLKKDLLPFAQDIANQVPSEPPLSGFGRHSGRTAWKGVRASAYVTPGGGRSRSLARIEVYGQGAYKAALKIADLAGTRNKYQRVRKDGLPDRRGAIMIRELEARYPLWRGRGGRFVWAEFMDKRGDMVRIAEEILDNYAERVMKAGI